MDTVEITMSDYTNTNWQSSLFSTWPEHPDTTIKGRDMQYTVWHTEINEKWNHHVPTRSSLLDIDNKKHIVLIGDSFTFGHGVIRDQALDAYLNKLTTSEYAVINLGIPGGSNNLMVTALCKWMNTKWASNLHTVIAGFTFHDRAEYQIERRNLPEAQIYGIEHEIKDSSAKPVQYYFSQDNPPTGANSLTEKIQIRKANTAHFEFFSDRINGLKEWEKSFSHIHSIAKANNANMLWWEHGIEGNLSPDDSAFLKGRLNDIHHGGGNKNILKYMDKFTSQEIVQKDPQPYHTSCNHWNSLGNELFAKMMINELKGYL